MKGIYLITNLINQKKYIGLSNNIKRRFAEHRSPKNIINRKTALYNAFRKYNIDNFKFEILEIVDDINFLAEKEIFWIEKIKPEYNMNQGGLGNKGHRLSEELKNSLRLKGKAQWNNNSEKTKLEIISKNLTGPKKGHLVSSETRMKLRQKNLGVKQSLEIKNKISKANKKSMLGNKNGNKSVIISKDGFSIKFKSLLEASKHINCHPSNITKVLKGKQKSCKGYFFKYGV